MALKRIKSVGLPLVLLLATLPGAVLAAVADMIRQRFVALAMAPPPAPKTPHWLPVPFSLYYVTGILLGFLVLTGVDAFFRFSPLACRAYTSLNGRKPGQVVFGLVFGGGFGLGWLTLSYITGIGSNFIIVGFGPAVAVGWWLKHRGYWPVGNASGNISSPRESPEEA